MFLHHSPLRRLSRAATAPFRYLRQQLRWWRVTSVAVAVAWLPPYGDPTADEAPSLPYCQAPRALLLESLASELDEHLVVQLIGPDGRLVEFTASASGNWTLLTTIPGGETCLQGGGQGLRLWPLPLPRS